MVGKRARIVEEPWGATPRPAIGYAALAVGGAGAHDGMAVLAADHLIPDLEDFRKDPRSGPHARRGRRPPGHVRDPADPPGPGFGYVEKGAPLGPERAFEVLAFREKPDLATARDTSAAAGTSGTAACSPGGRARSSKGLERHRPALAQGVRSSRRPRRRTSRASRRSRGTRSTTSSGPRVGVSIDYAVMEKADNAAMIEASFEWDDLGSWTAWARGRRATAAATRPAAARFTIDSDDCVVLGGGTRPVVVLGRQGLIVVGRARGRHARRVPSSAPTRCARRVAELAERGWLEDRIAPR
jgi:mannose-1-phosphate guanylyltransferase